MLMELGEKLQIFSKIAKGLNNSKKNTIIFNDFRKH